MLRIKRSVQAQYNTDVGYVAASAHGGAPAATIATAEDGDPMAALEGNVPLTGFVESSTGPVGGGAKREEKEPETINKLVENPDAIELGDDDNAMEKE